MLAEIIKLINITGQDHQSRYHDMTDGVMAKDANEPLEHFYSHSPKDMLMTNHSGHPSATSRISGGSDYG